MKSILQHMLVLTALLLLAAVSTVQSANIIVDEKECRLDEAVISANNDNAEGSGCVDGNGDDTILLNSDVVLATYLPAFTSSAIIEGNGHTIDGNGVIWPVLRIQKQSPNDIYFTVNNTNITGGSAGISIQHARSVIVNNTTVSGAAYAGIGAWGTPVTLNNSTVSHNGGDGISVGRASIALNSSTVSGNAAGIFVSGDASATMSNSLIVGNDAYELRVYGGSRAISRGYNVFGHSGKARWEALRIAGDFMPDDKDLIAASDGANIPLTSIIDPELKDNGGTVPTHALPDGSPAVDLDPTCSAALLEDQRGYPRPVGEGCDAGAFEAGGDLRMALHMTLRRALDRVGGFEPAVFQHSKMRIPLTNQLNAVLTMIEQDSHAEALDKLRNSLIGKTDGCAAAGTPDNNDWIMDCASQKQVHSLLERAARYLEELI